MLKPMSKAEENRIVRNIVQACTESVHKLNKYGYRWIHTKSGFIAHYNLLGFIGEYGSASRLRSDVLEHQMSNQHSNWHEGEADYPYYKQSRDIYNRICDILHGKRQIPAESTCYRAPSLKEIIDGYIKKGYTTEKTVQACVSRYMHVFECGTFFCGDYEGRATDLAYITELYNCLEADGEVTEVNFYTKEFAFPSGNTGTFRELMGVYGEHLYDVFAELTGQLEEVT